MPMPTDDVDPVTSYKAIFRAVLEARPSGMRQRIAETLGTTRGFISQISNPNYATPIPAAYLPAIFEVCHFSDDERKAFVAAYDKAHPGRIEPLSGRMVGHRMITIEVPDFGDTALNHEMESRIRSTVENLVEIAVIARAGH